MSDHNTSNLLTLNDVADALRGEQSHGQADHTPGRDCVIPGGPSLPDSQRRFAGIHPPVDAQL